MLGKHDFLKVICKINLLFVSFDGKQNTHYCTASFHGKKIDIAPLQSQD